MTDNDIETIAEVVRDFVDESQEKLSSEISVRFAALEAREPNQPGKDGKDVDPELVRLAIIGEVRTAISEIPFPKDGKDVDPEAVRAFVIGEVKHALTSYAKPLDGVNGKDAEPVNKEAITVDVLARVRELYPIPKDGKDADPTETRALVEAEVARAVALIPPAAAGSPGRDAEPVDVALVAAEVLKHVAVPKDGKDADPTETRALVEAEVARAVALIPPAAAGSPGRDAEPVDVNVIVQTVLAHVASEAEVARAVADDVNSIFDFVTLGLQEYEPA